MVVILDEADYLKSDALEFSRRLVNDLGQSGLVLVGLPRLTGTIQNLRNDHQQLESRIGVYLPLTGLSREDAKKIAQSVWPDIDNDVVDAMYRISRTDVRQFVKIMERAQNTMAVNKLTEIDLDVVETAAMLVIRRNRRG
jgi:DNA transposition AAA+ family ATPase